MPTMHGIGHHHYTVRMHEWKVWRFIKNVLSRIFHRHEHQALRRLLDKSIVLIGVMSPIMTIPQIYKIFTDGSAKGLSAISWSTYIVVSAFWLMYGIVHKEKPIILVNLGWVIVHAATLTGIVLYG